MDRRHPHSVRLCPYVYLRFSHIKKSEDMDKSETSSSSRRLCVETENAASAVGPYSQVCSTTQLNHFLFKALKSRMN